MAHLRRTLALSLALCLLGGACLLGTRAEEAPALRFRDDGSFTILCFADTHQTADEQPQMTAFLGEAIDAVRPDLVVFLGDNVYSTACEDEESERLGIRRILTPLLERGQKFALVFGNHDTEYRMPGKTGAEIRKELMRLYQDIGGALCLASDAAGLPTGASNYNLPIYGRDASKAAANLWFFDTGSNQGKGGYDWVQKEQIDWYKAESAALKAANGGQPVPSLAFQHIVVPEVYDNFIDIFGLRIPDFTRVRGYVMEPPCPPISGNDGQVAAMAEMGDVMAMVFGHDHVNSYSTTVRGVTLEQIPGATFGGSYGTDILRGATVFTLREDQPGTYARKPLLMRDLAKQPGSKIGGNFRWEEIYCWLIYALEYPINALVNAVASVFRG